jgi:serine/threonine protein kinase
MSSPSALPGFEPTQHYQRHARVALVPGSRVGDFEIVRVLGVGGFSIVYLARDLALSRLVALKEYLPSALAMRGEGVQVALRTSSNEATFEQGLDSFIEEARMLARFDHPSLVRVHHFWKANGTAYMAMRYLEGMTLLAARRAMPRPPDEAWLRALLGSLLGAIETLHSASCLHRDISPDNVLLLPDDTPVLLDFGAARSILGDGSQQLTAILKPGFAPIEQYAEATDLRQGPWTDLYALGAVVRNCITARPPIPSTVRAVGDRLPSLALEVRTLAASFPGLSYSPGFLAAIDWALALRPADRPQSVAEFRQALARDGAVAVARQGPREPVRSPPVDGASVDRSAAMLGRWAARARGAAASLSSSWWPARVAAVSAVAASDRESADMGFRSTAPEPAAARQALPVAAAPWLPGRAHWRRALPWSLGAVLLGAAASVAWSSLEERRIGRDMAVVADSAAAAAAHRATPDVFAAPPLAHEPGPEDVEAVPAPPAEVPEDLPRLAMSPGWELHADPDVDLITELRDPAPTLEPETGAASLTAAAEQSPPPAAMARVGAPAAASASDRRRAGLDGARETSAPSRRRTAAAPADSPRRICARQERYTDYVCMKRQCQQSRFSDHPQCTSLRKTGWWGFIRLP